MKTNYQLINERELPEIQSSAKLYRHLPTGAEILSVVNRDENKVFGVTFRTPPKDSTGIAHILEHSVLSGSEKYPLKDPFVQLIKGSLKTFVNAFTYPDKTCYPTASQHLQDFYNLIDVYMDAVFHPRITREIFDQEGWHYERDPESGQLRYSGVVFNEMKGVYSSPDMMLGEAVQQSLFPDTLYGLDSGGHPAHIPDLTYEAFKAFHADYYHPSNARFYFWGDDPPEERLKLMDQYLAAYESRVIESSIPLQPLLRKPVVIRKPFPSDDADDDKCFVTLNWAFPEMTDPLDDMAWHVLAHTLLGTPASPLRKALIESGLGEDIAGAGLEDELRQWYFSTGLKGVPCDRVDEAPALIRRTLSDLVEHGLDPDDVQAAINTLEFSLREGHTGSFPRGLVYMLRALNHWLYDRDPLAAIAFEDPLTALKRQWKDDPDCLIRRLKAFTLDNPHCTTVVLEPDTTVEAACREAEQTRLRDEEARMKEADLNAWEERTKALKAFQSTADSPEALDSIPQLSIGDLPRENRTVPRETGTIGDVPLIVNPLETQGIIYLNAGFDVAHCTVDDLVGLEFLLDAMIKMGTRKQDYVQLSRRIGIGTGGIDTSTYTALTADGQKALRFYHLRGKCLPGQLPELIRLYTDLLTDVSLESIERARQILLEEKASLESHLVPHGHRIVQSRLMAGFHAAGAVAEHTDGMAYLLALRDIIEQAESDADGFLARMKSLYKRVVARNRMHVHVTASPGLAEDTVRALYGFCDSIPEQPVEPEAQVDILDEPSAYFTAPANVHFVGKAARLYASEEHCPGGRLVAARYLYTTRLWEEIRMKGGAYGAIVSLGQRSGICAMTSYRDPHVDRTLKVYDETAAYLQQLRLPPKEIERAVIGAIGEWDTYRFPESKGYLSLKRYLAEETEEELQARREEMLSTTVKDFHALGERMSVLSEQGHTVVLGGEKGLEASERLASPHTRVVKVL